MPGQVSPPEWLIGVVNIADMNKTIYGLILHKHHTFYIHHHTCTYIVIITYMQYIYFQVVMGMPLLKSCCTVGGWMGR